MSTLRTPRIEPPRRIESGEYLRFAPLSRRTEGVRFRGGLHFFQGLPFDTSSFPHFERLMLLRGPRPGISSWYRTVHFSDQLMLFLWDSMVDHRRGVVLELATLSLEEPSEHAAKLEMELEPKGPWVTDVALAGQDTSQQTWLHHVPPRMLRGGVEACERWIFRMKHSDIMVREL